MNLLITVRRNGNPIIGARVTATVNGVECATVLSAAGVTSMQFPTTAASEACRQVGATIRIEVDGQQLAMPTATFMPQATLPLDLDISFNVGLQVADAPDCREARGSLFCVYTVQAGDNFGIIATKFGLRGNDNLATWELLVWSNRPDVAKEDDLLTNGQKLRIPAQPDSVIHTVLASQTVKDIAEMYGVQPEDILGVAANGLSDTGPVSVGQEILVPNPKHLGPPPTTQQSQR